MNIDELAAAPPLQMLSVTITACSNPPELDTQTVSCTLSFCEG